jgi:hypothetical protein
VLRTDCRHSANTGQPSLLSSATSRVTLDRVTDEPSIQDLEQLARSVAMSGVLGDRDRLDVVVALRRLGRPPQHVRSLHVQRLRPRPTELGCSRCQTVDLFELQLLESNPTSFGQRCAAQISARHRITYPPSTARPIGPSATCTRSYSRAGTLTSTLDYRRVAAPGSLEVPRNHARRSIQYHIRVKVEIGDVGPPTRTPGPGPRDTPGVRGVCGVCEVAQTDRARCPRPGLLTTQRPATPEARPPGPRRTPNIRG